MWEISQSCHLDYPWVWDDDIVLDFTWQNNPRVVGRNAVVELG